MKKSISKLFATISAISMLASISAGVSADDTTASAGSVYYPFNYEMVNIGVGESATGVIITGVSSEPCEATDNTSRDAGYFVINGEGADFISIPTALSDGEVTYDVIGVADFAFAGLDNLTTIYEGDAELNPDYMGNVAFITKQSVTAFIKTAFGTLEPSQDDVIKYVAKEFKYNGKEKGWTTAELAEVRAKLDNKAQLAGVTEDMDIITAIVTMLQNKDKMTLSEETNNRLTVWEAAIPYTNVGVVLSDDSLLTEYVAGRAKAGLYDYAIIFGDANNDGIVNVRDAAAIATALANGKASQLPAKSDYNGDGNINVRDAAAIARDLASSIKNETAV